MYRLPERHVRNSSGFSLIELVVGIVVLSIALSILSVTFFSSPGRAVEPMMQARAAEYGQALMEEILSKRFDELSPVGGVPPCTSCTVQASFGKDGAETRDTFDDVDDYNEYCGARYNLEDIFGNTAAEFGTNFKMEICVTYASANNLKRIQIDMYPPGVGGLQSPISFVGYRGNF